MPDCDRDKAIQVGERLRQCIAATPFEVGGRAGTLLVTASVGVAALERAGDTPELISAESGRILGLALGFRLDAALEALGLRPYISCVFVTLASQ